MTEIEVRHSYGEYRGELIVPPGFALFGNHLRCVENNPFLKRLYIDVLHLQYEMMVAFFLPLFFICLACRKERRVRFFHRCRTVDIIYDSFPLLLRRQYFFVVVCDIRYVDFPFEKDIKKADKRFLVFLLSEYLLKAEVGLYIDKLGFYFSHV